jgi:hypothetical protein
MANNNSRMIITELDFDTILQNLQNFMQNQSVFTDYNFTGSGLQVLLKELSYNDHYLAYYMNMLGNESNISTALVRDNIVLHAKALNYVPFSMTSPSAFVNVVVTPSTGNGNPAFLTLPRYTPFQSQSINGQNFTYNTIEGYTTSYDSGNNIYTFANVQINEGQVVNYTYTASVNNPRNSFNIPNANIDTSTLIINVTENTPSPSATYPYAYSTDVSLLTGNSRVYFLEGSYANTYNLYFGDGILGKALSPGDYVTATYLVTYGPASNMANSFTCMNPIGGYGNVITQSVSASSGGNIAETADSIKLNAPISNMTQERAVTVNDYKFLLQQNYSNIGSVSVWGGDQNNPPVYGVPFISIKPVYGNYLTPIQKQQVLGILQTYNITGIVPQIVDPDYTYILFTIDVNYNPNNTTLNANQLIAAVQTQIANYANAYLGSFDSTYRESTINQFILNADPSIMGCSVEIYLQKRFWPTLNNIQTYTLQFYTPLLQGGINEKLYSSPGLITFDTFGNTQTCFIEENINTYQGISSIYVNTPGFLYTGQPIITITGDGQGATAEAVIVNGALQSVNLLTQGEGYTIATAEVTGGGGYGATITPILSSQIGILDLYYYTNTNKVILNTNLGTVDHVAGTVTINNINILGIQNQSQMLTLNAKPLNNIILPSQQNILLWDITDPTAITVNLIPQTT